MSFPRAYLVRRYPFQRGSVPATPLDAAVAARTGETAEAQTRFPVREVAII